MRQIIFNDPIYKPIFTDNTNKPKQLKENHVQIILKQIRREKFSQEEIYNKKISNIYMLETGDKINFDILEIKNIGKFLYDNDDLKIKLNKYMIGYDISKPEEFSSLVAKIKTGDEEYDNNKT